VDVSNDRHYTVLEVGAGSGRLSYYLKNKLQKDKNIFMVATDHGTYQLTINLCTARSIPNTHYTYM
jgi:tRNA A58 N-methylase Trm61